MTKLEIAKKATSLLVGFGTSKIVNDIIRTNTQPRHMLDTISIGLTSLVTGSMAAAATTEHSGRMIDEAVEVFQKLTKN